MVVAGDNPVVVFRVYVPAHCTYRDISPRTEIIRARRRESPSSVRRCVAFFSPPGPESRFKPGDGGCFLFRLSSSSSSCLFFLSLTYTHTFFPYLSLPRSLLLYSSFPSPLKVKCIREETSPGRGGSDPPRAAPRETRVCGCSRMLRECESGTFRTIFRLAIHDRDLESRECIFLPPTMNGFSFGETALLFQLLYTKHTHLRHVLRSVILHLRTTNLSRREMIGNINERFFVVIFISRCISKHSDLSESTNLSLKPDRISQRKHCTETRTHRYPEHKKREYDSRSMCILARVPI